jgi:hypothetical protein
MLARSLFNMGKLNAQRSTFSKIGSLGLGLYTAKNFAYGTDNFMRRAKYMANCEVDNDYRPPTGTRSKQGKTGDWDLISLEDGNLILRNKDACVANAHRYFWTGGMANIMNSYNVDYRYTRNAE